MSLLDYIKNNSFYGSTVNSIVAKQVAHVNNTNRVYTIYTGDKHVISSHRWLCEKRAVEGSAGLYQNYALLAVLCSLPIGGPVPRTCFALFLFSDLSPSASSALSIRQDHAAAADCGAGAPLNTWLLALAVPPP